MVKASELRPNVNNWRKHPKKQQDAIRGVLAEFGIADAIVARELPDGTLGILDGHLRAEVDPNTEWPVLVLDVTEEEAKKILLTFDPLSAMASTDVAMLDALLKDTTIDNDAVRDMLVGLAKDTGCEWVNQFSEVTEDEVPEPPAEPITRPGDLWLLGEHRVLCGDATRMEDVVRLMGGQRASCVFTDPPYGVSIGAKNRLLNSIQKAGLCLENIESDDLSPDELKAMLLPAFVILRELVMAEDCTLFVSAPQGGELGMMMMMQEAGLRARHVLIWKKNQPTFSMGRLDYDYAHEPILLTWGKCHKRPMAGQHRTSVWEIDRERKCDAHPTMKPVALYANAYLNNSEPGDNVADIFCGSGTACIAAEQLGRKSFSMELSPAYCDVIVRRWENLTGKKATLAEPGL